MHILGLRLNIIKCINNSVIKRFTSSKSKPPWSVLFFGNDEFSLYSLQALHKEYRSKTIISNLEIVTSVQKKPNPIQKYAVNNELPIHRWPIELNPKQYDVGLVVSFGHLIPEKVIEKFEYGILNVHASLLPKWRGAAPIIYALANDEKETGVSVMRIKPKKFDVGDIITQAPIKITDDMKLPDLYEQLGKLGAQCLVSTLNNLDENLRNAKPQSHEGISLAPKVRQDFAQINWNKTAREIFNLERSIYGFLTPCTSWNGLQVKLSNIKESSCDFSITNDTQPGFVVYDKKDNLIKILCGNQTWISAEKVGVVGKRVMNSLDFNNGFVKKQILKNRYFK